MPAFDVVHGLIHGPASNDAEGPRPRVLGTRPVACPDPARTAAQLVDLAMKATRTSNAALAGALGVDPKLASRFRRAKTQHMALRHLLAAAHARPSFALEAHRLLGLELEKITGRAA